MRGFCTNCNKEVNIKNPKEENGMYGGQCPECGGQVIYDVLNEMDRVANRKMWLFFGLGLVVGAAISYGLMQI